MTSNADNFPGHADGDTEMHGLEIAIVGMAGRFPGADSVDAFWRNLLAGVEAIGELDEDALRAAGIDDALLNDPDWRRIGAPLTGSDLFDAGFFGYSPREAEILDPQQRVFLECAWHALENAGYDAARYHGAIGVFGGAGMNGYLLNLYANAQVRSNVSPYELFIANDKDFLTTRVSYKLGLQGPSVAVQTACSTSLVAVHLACQSLIGGECDMALAGGVAISRQIGYRVQSGGIYSPDGHCRAFDADAAGTVPGNGVGIVVLKRLSDATADGDSICAVIKGSAINNDGATKVSFTAPGVDAQAAVIRSAFDMAGVAADSIGYVEAHGTGTHLGDPIEIAALTRAFQNDENARKERCALGSVKTNIGHLDAAAGIASLIKAAFIVRDGQLPPSLHFTTPNPAIDFESTPFRVNAQLTRWNAPLRRAGVSCFGIGGTNAHMVLQQPPVHTVSPAVEGTQLLVLSARSEASLKQSATQLAQYLQDDNTRLADIAWTLQQGRRAFERRITIVADNHTDAIRQLRHIESIDTDIAPARSTLVWLFSGQGSQYPAMACGLYHQHAVFRAALDHCAATLKKLGGPDLIELLCDERVGDALDQTANTQPALFAFGYAQAMLWQSLGLQPQAMIGHSLGEYIAACIAGVFDVDTALQIVYLRARLMQAMAPGAMLAVLAPAETVQPWLLDKSLREDTSLAAINGAAMCVLSGDVDSVERMAARCQADNIGCQRLRTSHAFHSPMMAEAAAQLGDALRAMQFNKPRLPFISNISGSWISDSDATDPQYWVRHMLAPVQFAAGVQTLLSLPGAVFLEIGAGTTLSGLVKRAADAVRCVAALPSASKASQQQLLDAVGKLWCHGIDIDWRQLHDGARRRVALPGYAFERQRYRVDANALPQQPSNAAAIVHADSNHWTYAPSWQRQPLPAVQATSPSPQTWLLLLDNGGIGNALSRHIENASGNVFTAVADSGFSQRDYREFGFDADSVDSLRELRMALQSRDLPPQHIVDLRNADVRDAIDAGARFKQLHALLMAWSETSQPVQISIITRNACDVLGDENLDGDAAVVQGLCQVAGQEYPQLGCRQIDLASTPQQKTVSTNIAAALWNDLNAVEPLMLVALRGNQRWQLQFAPLSLPDIAARGKRGVRRDGSYIVIGDLEHGHGAIWAQALSAMPVNRLVLASSTTPVSAQLIEQCRTQGTEVVALQIDTSDTQSLHAAFDAAGDTITGVFCSLPTTNAQSAAPMALLNEQHWHYNRVSRIDLLQAVAAMVEQYQPAWCCVQASMASVLGGIGLAPYAAANQVVDTFVAQQNRSGNCAWFALNWDAVSTELANAQGPGANLQEHAVTPADVWNITQRVLATAAPGQIAISRSDINARRQQWLHASGRTAAANEGSSAHARPALGVEFVAPRNDVERTIASLWQELLRIDCVGVNDGFFDLGGHSLLAIQAIGRLRQAFPVQLELRQLLDGTPTVAGIAALISAQLPAADDIDLMAALLAEVQAMSSEDVAAELLPHQLETGSRA